MSNLETAIHLATKQHRVFSILQLKKIGIPSGSIQTMVQKDIFKKLTIGVYTVDGSGTSWHESAMASVLGAGPNAALSHESALINLKLLKEDFISLRKGKMIPFHVTLPRSSSRRITSSIHRSIYKDESTLNVVVNAIPQVPIEIALIESARHLPEQFLNSVFDVAIREKFTTAKKIKVTLDLMWPAPGRSKTRVQENIGGHLANVKIIKCAESALEVRILRIISGMTNCRVSAQFQVHINGNRYRLDIAIPDQKIAIEVDGYAFHCGREAFDNDKKRQNDLVSNGWRVLRFTATQTNEEIRLQFRKLLSDGSIGAQYMSVKQPIA